MPADAVASTLVGAGNRVILQPYGSCTMQYLLRGASPPIKEYQLAMLATSMSRGKVEAFLKSAPARGVVSAMIPLLVS